MSGLADELYGAPSGVPRFGLADDLYGNDRITTEIKEVIMYADRIDAEYFLPYFSKFLFGGSNWWRVFGFGDVREIWQRQSFFIDFPVWSEG